MWWSCDSMACELKTGSADVSVKISRWSTTDTRGWDRSSHDGT